MMTIATSTSRASTRCSVSCARRSSTPPPKSSSVAHPAAIWKTRSGMTSARRLALGALVGLPVALANGVRVAGVDQVDDQHAAFLVDVDRDLVGRFAGQHAPQGDAVARAAGPRDLDETGPATPAEAETRR